MTKGVAFLMRKNKIDVFRGQARLLSPTDVEVAPDGQRIASKTVILATGARPRQIPTLPIDGTTVLGSREALALRELPRSVVIVGAGPVGLEFAYVWSSYGAQITVVEALPRALPQEDEEISAQIERLLGRKGVRFVTGAPVDSLTVSADGVTIRLNKNGAPMDVTADKALVSIGVQGNSDDLGLEALGVNVERSWAPVDAAMRTNVPGVYAIGDLTGKMMLAHVASAQGVIAAEAIAGRATPTLDYDQMPRATYCNPEVASIGLTEQKARANGHNVITGSFPFRPNGRALAMSEPDGLVKVVADAKTKEILGVHMLGKGVSELLGEASLARTLEATPAELGFAVHAHPTMSEAIKEAALAALGEAIHI
jgi:dihydrolipoamide dehydrogenase